jgi:small GTP-binding protein
MVDITKTESFNKVSELIPLVYEKMKENIDVGDVPLFFISNKVDLEKKREVSGFEVKELIDHYSSINNFEITLNLEKNANDETINDLIIKLCLALSEQEKKYTYKYDSLNLVKINEPMKIGKESLISKYAQSTMNLLLLGSSSVGKSSFVQKIFKNQFQEDMLSTLGIDIVNSIVEVCGSVMKLELWDTVGQERLKSLPAKYYSKGDGFFLLFDVNDKKTFEDISGWIKDIRKERANANEENFEKKTEDEVLVLIGNKIDKIGQRQVSREEAIALANKYNLSYYETSCKQGINLYEILCDILFQAASNTRKETTKIILSKRKDKAKHSGAKKKCC